MSVDLKRVRDTHDDALSPASKKRALAGGVSPIGEDETGMEDWMKVVEVQRKEAIYRQMLEYKRESIEAARKIRQLEEQRRKLEASEHAVEVCWTQLVSVIQDLVGSHESEVKASIEPVLDPTLSQPAIESALRTRLPATKQLVSRFVDVAKQGNAGSSLQDLRQQCTKLQTETTTLRSVNSSLRSEIADLTHSRDHYRSSLARSEKRMDKQQMAHDRLEAERRNGQDHTDGGSTPGVKNGPVSGHATPNGHSKSDTKDVKPMLDAAAGMLQDSAELERLAETRLQELRVVTAEHTALRTELDRIRLLVSNPSEESLRASPFFQIYLRQLATQSGELSASRQRFDAAETKLDELRNQNFEFRDAVLAEGRAEAEQLRAQVGRQNTDLARLRGQRDEMQAEIAERKLREEGKISATEQMDNLVKSREERISTLVSEVKRLKGMLATSAGDGRTRYLEFLHRDGVDADYIRDLEERLSNAETQVAALSAATNVEIAVELERARQQLAKYQSVLGSDPDALTEIGQLAKRLEAELEEKAALGVQLQEASSANNALYTEVEVLAKLSDSNEALFANKVFDLRDAEGRMNRLSTEKAKADNKYFQAMRTKEAIEGECRTAQRSVEKQARLLDKAAEVERALQSQVAAQEKGLTGFKNEALALQTQLAHVTSEKQQLELRLQQSQSSLAEAQNVMQQRVAEAAAEKEMRTRYQEDAEKGQSTIKKLRERQEQLLAHSGGSVSASELHMKEERDKLLKKLLRCSCCEQNFKQQVIVKCMHTFCKPCLDSRISTRQRKCPACGLAFAKEDVQTIYWQ